MRGYILGIAATAAVSWAGLASATPLLVDRGLPTDNLNHAAGADRSNVGWDFRGLGWFAGDDFTIVGSGRFQITSMRFWIDAEGGPGDAANNNADLADDSSYGLGDTYDALAFYFGEASGSAVPLQTLAHFTGGNTTDNADVSIRRVLYQSAESEFDYQGSSGLYSQLFEVTIENLGLIVAGGTSYQFGAECQNADDDAGDFVLCFMHATNAARAGSPQQGSDDRYRAFFVGDDLTGPAAFDTFVDSDGFGWDKSSDVNIQVFGHPVPEPGSLMLLGAGLLGLGAARRRPQAAC